MGGWNRAAAGMAAVAAVLGSALPATAAASPPRLAATAWGGPGLTPWSTPASTARAAAGSWLRQHTANLTQPNGQLGSVSCATDAMCIAVGTDLDDTARSAGLAEHWNGRAWHLERTATAPQAIDTTLVAVSCPSVTVCFAAGYVSHRQRTVTPIVERWDGGWSEQGVPGPPGAVAAGLLGISCTAADACVAVGDGQPGGGAPVPWAVRWDGAGWHPIAPPAPGGAVASGLFAVSCAAVAACTAVGSAVSASGTVPLAERWDGSRWTVQAVPVPAGAAATGFAAVSCPAATLCHAVGGTSDGGGAQAPAAESWNGSAWSIDPLATPQGAAADVLLGISCAGARACTAVGNATATSDGRNGGSGGAEVPLAERLAAAGWSAATAPSPAGSFAAGLEGVACVLRCAAVGSYQTPVSHALAFADMWDGTAWSVQPVRSPLGATDTSNLLAVSCAAATRCMAVGFASATPSQTVGFAEQWDAGAWRITPVPLPSAATGTQFEAVSCPALLGCVAVGDAQDASGGTAFAARWDGTRWGAMAVPPLPPGSQSAALFGVSCTSTRSCMAVGTLNTSSGMAPYALAWDGSRWSRVAVPGAAGALLRAVSCTSPGSCMAVGFGGGAVAETWDGHAWHAVTMPAPAGAAAMLPLSVSCTSPAFCAATGFAVTQGEVPAIAWWNGSRWTSAVLPPPAAGVQALNSAAIACTSPSACVVAGGYLPASERSVAFIEQWDGAGWTVPKLALPPLVEVTSLNAVACTGASACTAVGSQSTAQVQVTMAFARR